MIQHKGTGVARRAAEHVRQRAKPEAEEAEIEQPDEAERVAVAAEQVLATIPVDAPHYAPKPQREDKRKRRAAMRGMSSAVEARCGIEDRGLMETLRPREAYPVCAAETEADDTFIVANRVRLARFEGVVCFEAKTEADDTFIVAKGRELYHWLGFEATEARTGSATAAVVNSLPRRSWQPLFVLLQVAGCLYVAACASRELGLAVALVTIVTTYLLFDLYSGWVHYCLDWEGFNPVPFFGPLCQTFQHHHRDTTFIWRSNIWTNLSEVGLFLHISDTLPLALLSGCLGAHVPPIYWYCSAWKTLDSMIGELGHRAAHKPHSVRSGFERSMQRCGIFLNPKYHLHGHHRNLHEQFCELGWMDPVFDAMRRVTTNRWAWAAFTFCGSYADTWLLGAATMAVAGAGS